MRKTNSELEKRFLQTYSDQVYQYTTMVRHNGTLIAFAMGENRRIYYVALNLDGQDEQTIDAKNWSKNPTQLQFSNEIAQVGFGVVDAKTLPMFKFGGEELTINESVRLQEIDPFLSSTARFTADAPFQVLSDEKYVYVFRQSIGVNDQYALFVKDADGNLITDINGNPVPVVNETLLVDRFVFVDNQLRMNREVRFRRSRSKFRPLNSKDSLGAKDMDEMPFFEPTQELDFIRNLQKGRFSVLQLPTQIADIKRWQIFAHNSQTGRIDSFNIERSQDGWFNTKGSELTANGSTKFAESALQLDGVDDYIDLGEFNPGENFSVEMWVQPRQKSGDAPTEIPHQILLSKTNSNGEDIFSFGYYADFLGVNFKGIQLPTSAAAQSQISQAIANWHHVGVTLEQTENNSTKITAYQDGVEVWSEEISDNIIADFSGNSWQLGRKFDGEQGSDYFDGSVDEVRIWNRALFADEIAENLNYRLIGNELGLLGYWRFDEGIGSNLYDQTDNALHGQIYGMVAGEETWIASAAPLGESRGISRSSFGFKHHSVESGLSALLYFQQEDIASGYDQTPKPTKQNARVMLAVATRSVENESKHVSILDFAVTKNGKLAQVLDNIPLEKVKNRLPMDLLPEGIDSNDVSLIDLAKNLETNTIPSLESELAILLADYALVNTQINANQQETKNLQRRKDELERERANSKAGARFYQAQNFQGSSFSRQQGYDGGFDGFAGSSLRSLQLDSGVRVSLYAGSDTVHVYSQSRSRIGGTYGLTPFYDRIVVDLGVLVDELNGINNRLNQLAAEFSRLDAQRRDLEAQLMSKRTELEMKRAQLTEIRKLLMGEKSLPLPLIHLDPMGMSVFGGLLEFAETTDSPQLFDSATGQLALYFRGEADQFFAAYYDTNTSRANLALMESNIMLVARAPGEDLGNTRITISDGATENTCTVKLQSVPPAQTLARISELEAQKTQLQPGENVEISRIDAELARLKLTITETWQNVPRDGEQFAAVLNGQNPEYDYANNAKSDRRAYNLKHGSFFVNVVAASPAGTVKNTEPNGKQLNNIGLSPRWVANPPGNTIAFTNTQEEKEELYLIAEAGAEKFAIPGDVSLEAWMRPEDLEPRARIIEQHSANSRYALGLNREELPTALRFNGNSDYVQIPQIDLRDRSFTIEFWAKRESGNFNAFFSSVFAQGSPNPNQLLHIGFRANHVFTFAFNNNDFNINLLNLPGGFNTTDWHHWACTYDNQTRRRVVYLDGRMIGEDIATASFQGTGNLRIGAYYPTNLSTVYPFLGSIDEVRVWDHSRSEQAIKADMKWRLFGNESGLLGYWSFPDRQANDLSGNNRHGKFQGNPSNVASPLLAYSVYAGSGNKFVKTRQEFQYRQWENFAVVYNQSYALRFDGVDDYLDAGNGNSLNLNQDLTIEARVRLDSLATSQGIISKGVINSGNLQQKIPYAVYVSRDGRVVFASEDQNQNLLAVSSRANAVQAGQIYHLAVTRKKRREGATVGNADLDTLGIGRTIDVIDLGSTQQIDNNAGAIERAMRADYVDAKQRERRIRQQRQTNTQFPAANVPELSGSGAVESLELRIYLNGILIAERVVPAADLGTNDQPLEIGKAYGQATTNDQANVLGNAPNYLRGVISEVRLWNQALTANELNRNLNGTERSLVSWWQFEEGEGSNLGDTFGNNDAAIKGATWMIDPDPQGSTLRLYHNGVIAETENIAAIAPSQNNQFIMGQGYEGNLDEVRIWKIARTEENILDNLFGRLKGEKQDLIAYYTFDRDRANADVLVRDNSLQGNQLIPNRTQSEELRRIDYVFSTAPICDDIALIRNAIEGVKTDFQDVIQSRPAVEEYGDLQYTALGDLVGSMKRSYSLIKDGDWRLYTGFKVGNILTEWVGQVQFDPQVMGFVEGAPPIPSENLTEDAGDDFNDATALEIIEAENVTYTLSSEKEQGYNTSLSFAASIGVEGDINTLLAPLGFGISFPIEFNLKAMTGGQFESSQAWSSSESQGRGINNNRNTSVSLRGEWEDANNPQIPEALTSLGRRYLPSNVGFAIVQSETADVFALRLAHNRALVSYRFRPNRDIPRDTNLIPFPIDATYTKQGTLDGAVGYSPQGKILDPDYLNATDLGESSYFKPREAYALRNRIQQEEQQLKTFYENFQTTPRNRALDASVAATQGAIADNISPGAANAITRMMSPANATDTVAEGFAKRNLVNTYVWTAEGGFFAESTQTSTVRQETTGSSYSSSSSMNTGLEFGISGLGISAGFEFNATTGGQLNVTKTATKDSETSYEISVNLNVPGNVQTPGKVDAYRFLTFSLEPSPENFNKLFTDVIDPIWLNQSNHPNAVALRQANNSDKKPPCWRVFHRVTFVSRVLPQIPDSTMPPLERALMAANIESNWQLIQRLDPLVRNQTSDFGVFAEAVRKAIRRYLPELQTHESEIIEYMALYYGLEV